MENCTVCGTSIYNVSARRMFCDTCKAKRRKESHRRWDINNKEKKKLMDRIYRRKPENKINQKEYMKKYYIDNKKRIQMAHALYYQKNRFWLDEITRNWWKTPDGRLHGRKYTRNRRAIKSNIVEVFTISEWLEKVEKTNGICPNCGKNVGTKCLCLDHIYPISKAELGRIYTIDDIQPLCKSCNSKKGDKI